MPEFSSLIDGARPGSCNVQRDASGPMRLTRILGVVFLPVLLTLVACGPGGAPAPATGSAQAAATVASGAGGGPPARPVSTRPAGRTSSASVQAPELVATGKVVFDQTAGGVGCAFCHGMDGRGKREFAAPDIRGKTASDVLNAMQTRAQMSTVKLSDDEVKAVVAYLSVLADAP